MKVLNGPQGRKNQYHLNLSEGLLLVSHTHLKNKKKVSRVNLFLRLVLNILRTERNVCLIELSLYVLYVL
jgi:hypothetical protein